VVKISSRQFLVAALAIVTFGFAAGARAEQWTKTYAVTGHAQVRLTTNDGSIEVNPAAGNQIVARVDTMGLKIDPNDVTIDEHQTGDLVQIEVHVKQHSRFISVQWHSPKIYLDVPRESDLDLHSGDGSISAHDIKGSLRFDSGDGNLRVDNLHGDLRFHSGDGHIEGSGLDGALEAETGDGNINVRGRFDRVEAHSGDGDVEINIENGSKMNGPWTVHTSDGKVRMRLPDGFSAELDAHTGDGRISTDFPITMSGSLNPSSLRGKLGNGGESLKITSGDGSIYIEKI
jgi:DUF4097 and DUF4098 domain-containing protein YvlB